MVLLVQLCVKRAWSLTESTVFASTKGYQELNGQVKKKFLQQSFPLTCIPFVPISVFSCSKGWCNRISVIKTISDTSFKASGLFFPGEQLSDSVQHEYLSASSMGRSMTPKLGRSRDRCCMLEVVEEYSSWYRMSFRVECWWRSTLEVRRERFPFDRRNYGERAWFWRIVLVRVG